jgi:hypothetical protein
LFLTAVGLCTLTGTASLLTACQDDWDDHYDTGSDTQRGSVTLYDMIASRADLSDFRRVVDSVRVFTNHRVTALHYSDVLDSDQFYTLFAPVNGSFNADSLLELCATSQGDSLVEQHFLKNHLARYRHSSASGLSESVSLLNSKTVLLEDDKIDVSRLSERNIACKNGLLHIVDGSLSYYYNIYEGLGSVEQYQHIGTFLHSYQTEEFDPDNSLATGIVDGKTVYIDSVFIDHNDLLSKTYGYIDSEDSTYWMLVPPAAMWDSLFAEADTYYNFGTINKADSIHDYWVHYALLQNLVYNPNAQRSMQDSLMSTCYNANNDHPEYNVAYTPFAPGGLFSYVADSVDCSNGKIYELASWPFDKTSTYFTPIKVEGEGRIYKDHETDSKTLTLTRRTVVADTVSGGYLAITPQTVYDSYYVTYEVPNVLSGEYDVYVVILPKTVYNPAYSPTTDKKQFRPNKFTAQIEYTGTDGKTYTLKTTDKYVFDATNPGYYVKSTSADAAFIFDCNFTPTAAGTRAFTNDPYRVDTIKLATIKFPTCNYAQQPVTTRVSIYNSIKSNQTNSYNAEIFLDCFYLKPHTED